MGFRRRVNRGGVLDLGLASNNREEITAQLKAFSQEMKSKSVAKSIVVVEEKEQDESKEQCTENQNKKIAILEKQLDQAHETIRDAKEMDANLIKVNAQLQKQVNQLQSENQKLYTLATYLRNFERENKELKFLLGDLFKPTAAGVSAGH